MDVRTEQLLARLKALADPVRMRIVALCSQAECSVSELTAVVGLSQPRVSQHLKALCGAGWVERFRDGHFVYYRVPARGGQAGMRRRLLALLPDAEPQFDADLERLRRQRAVDGPAPATAEDRLLHRALLELTLARPLGDLLDVGCGQGRLLKLLASRAHRVVGVDVDAGARRLARAEILLAGLPNCTLRQGDMHALPFEDAAFDTIILDDVLNESAEPQQALLEARRLLRPGGRILLLSRTDGASAAQLGEQFSGWAAATELRLSPPRPIPEAAPVWLLAVATEAGSAVAAA